VTCTVAGYTRVWSALPSQPLYGALGTSCGALSHGEGARPGAERMRSATNHSGWFGHGKSQGPLQGRRGGRQGVLPALRRSPWSSSRTSMGSRSPSQTATMHRGSSLVSGSSRPLCSAPGQPSEPPVQTIPFTRSTARLSRRDGGSRSAEGGRGATVLGGARGPRAGSTWIHRHDGRDHSADR
jgi:hypothetical protein